MEREGRERGHRAKSPLSRPSLSAPARAMDPPAAAAASSVLAPGLAPCAPRVPALDLAAVAAGRGPSGGSWAEPCCQDHPPHRLTARAASPRRGLGRSVAPALRRLRSHALGGPAAFWHRHYAHCPATESLLFPGLTVASPRRSGGGRAGGGKVAPRFAATSTTMASDAWARARELEGAASDGDRWTVDATSLDGGCYQHGDVGCPCGDRRCQQ
ncbi:unnamed protein product [Prorocentrum cordatum]|uniref:Uncharacterized protein n=1 Tax=Prorocentrum cordatum TaxID=2364126 RepID=A0ABN9PJC0_9DINO|nr:unnamed protein product [Polarella glacialis]